jgi:alpha-beta hydrolase superfamily lysophospholipase
MKFKRLDLPPEGDYHTVVLFAHCFTCGKNVHAAAHISRFLAQKGFALFRFDFTGLGESQGDFAETSFATNVADLVAAAQFLERNHQAPRVLIGHSLGGAAVIQAADRIPSAAALVTIGAPADPRHVLTHLDAAKETIMTQGEAVVNLAGRPFRLKKRFIDDLERSDPKAALKKLNRAILILHSPIDNTVGIEQAGALFQMARHPKSFVSLDRADHLLTAKPDAEYAAGVIAAWVQRYL